MKDVAKTESNAIFDWIKNERFHNEELWEKNVLDATGRTHQILDDHYENASYVILHQK